MKNHIKMGLIPSRIKNLYLSKLDLLVRLALKLNIHPNALTTAGFLLSCASAYLVATGMYRIAACLLLLGGMFDNIDGLFARATNKVTKFGALYDSTLDRYSEVIFFFGMAFYFIRNGWYLTSVFVAIGLGGSLMVSYIRARAEGLGYDCKIGLMQRPERIVLLSAGGLIHLYALVTAVWIIAILSNFTAIQRLLYVWKKDNQKRPSLNEKKAWGP
jgi:CDP-diacylglycerol--glycerol-3-phosphate 3-phosphatidyltransferase